MILTTMAVIAAATPAPNIAQVTQTAKGWFTSLQSGKVLDPKQLTDEVAQELTPDALAQVKKQVGDFGEPSTLTLMQSGEKMSNTYYMFDVACATGKHATMIVIFDDATGKISSLRITPAV